MALAALLGTAIGLLISAAANTRDQTNTIVPLALVPQLILSGSLVPNLPKWVDALAQIFISAHWITEAMVAVAIGRTGPLKQFDLANLSRILREGRPQELLHLQQVARDSNSAALCLILLCLHILGFLAAAYFTTLWRHQRRAG